MIFSLILFLVGLVILFRLMSFIFVTVVCIPEYLENIKEITRSHWKKFHRS